ncbi:MAG: hypothetical protein KAI47_14595 [Deltaproteobacteria bacterium]|nr:hypothetical protein [Deltaproteobacteria bacterium]
MKQTTYLLALIAMGGLAIAACSDDTGTQLKDGGADRSVTDGNPTNESNLPLPEAGADKGPAPLKCEAKCTAEAAYLCVTDTQENKCVECKEDGHCAGNPAALGPKCDQGYCSCATNDECKANKNGKTCDTQNKLCSCTADTECTTPEKCVGSLFGAKICAIPCAKDGDCSGTTPKCEKATGRCVACLADTDCTEEGATHCNTALGQCAQCNDATHCAGNISGNACVDGSCSCAKDGDCAATSWGPKCITKKSLFGEYKECGCNQTTECAANQNGPTCFDSFNKCSCDDDAKCTTTGLNKCNFPYGGATYKHCQKACTTNPDCAKIKDLNVCNTTNGKCVGCLLDTDCTSQKPFCSSTVGSCVACKIDTDCKSPGLPFCSAKGACVECKADPDCATNQSGSKCAEGACGCDADTDCKTNAWGNKCVAGSSGKSCGCSAAQECTGNQNGTQCDSSYSICTCKADGDCKATGYTKCGKPFSGAPVSNCHKPCTQNTDCKVLTGLAICETTKSICIGCKAATDCTYNAFEKACQTTSNDCVECLATADCTANANAFGPKCDTKSNYCVCASDAECASNPSGHVCDSQLEACSCVKDTDCPTGKTCTGDFAGVMICK